MKGLGKQNKVVLLVGACHRVEQLYEHRHISYSGEAYD